MHRLRGVFGAALLACAMNAAIAQTGTLRIQGNVAQPLTMSVEDIKRLPIHTAEITPKGESQGAPKAQPIQYRGALLRDVLAAAKPVESEPRELRRSYVVVTAKDGYAVVFSWAELFISPAGETVLVAFERDGKPLRAGEGPLAVVASADTSAARHVKWLETIELHAVK